jgi:predicted dehydrogenase
MTRQSAATIAIVGLGLIGPRHAQSVVNCDTAQLLCFVDPSPSAPKVAESFQVPIFSSTEHMLQNGYKPDAAIVCTPNKTHAMITKELLAAGINVLVEKPVSTTIPDGKEMIKTASSTGKHLLVGHHRRFNPYISATKKALLDGVVGSPVAISGLWALFKPPSYFAAPTEWRAKFDGGGVVLINVIHEVDILQFLFGPITKIHAERTASTRGHEAEEGAAILLRFESGLVGTFVIVDSSPSAHSFESGTGENPTIPKTGKDFLRIFGTEATLSVGDMLITRHLPGEEKSWTNAVHQERLPVGDEIPFDEQIKNLVKVVCGEEQPRCSGEDGLSALLVCEGIRRALGTDEAVVVER